MKNRVRITGGLWRSRLIAFADRGELRPTPDRVRVTLFNWLGQDLTGKTCLDLYAGSGALGFEAASRGARGVTLVERDRVTCKTLEKNRQLLDAPQVQVVNADALEFLRGRGETYDVVFLDPPFASDDWDALFAVMTQRTTPEAMVYRESGSRQQAPAGWEIHRQSRAGQVNYQLLKRM